MHPLELLLMCAVAIALPSLIGLIFVIWRKLVEAFDMAREQNRLQAEAHGLLRELLTTFGQHR